MFAAEHARGLHKVFKIPQLEGHHGAVAALQELTVHILISHPTGTQVPL